MIVILISAPLAKQNFFRCGIPILSEYSPVVTIECSQYLNRENAKHFHDTVTWENVFAPKTLKEISVTLSDIRPHYVIDFIGVETIRPLLQRIAKDCGSKYVIVKGFLPQPQYCHRIRFRVQRALNDSRSSVGVHKPTFNVRQAIRSLKTRIRAIVPSKQYDMAITYGKKAATWAKFRAKLTLSCRAQDYYTFQQLEEESACVTPQVDYAVFIDDNLAYAHDWNLLGLNPPVTPEKYFKKMRHIFSKIESEWGLKLLIAAHPSSYSDKKLRSQLGTYSIIYDTTAELVKNAQIVVAHASSSISFAVLARKKIICLTSDELDSSRYGYFIRQQADELDLFCTNIDSCERLPELLDIDINIRAYKKYICNYLSSDDCTEKYYFEQFLQYADLNRSR